MKQFEYIEYLGYKIAFTSRKVTGGLYMYTGHIISNEKVVASSFECYSENGACSTCMHMINDMEQTIEKPC